MKNNLRSEISKISFEFVEDVVKMSMSNRINKTYYISKFSKKILALIKKHERGLESKITSTWAKDLNRVEKFATSCMYKIRDYKKVLIQKDQFFEMLLKEKRTTKQELAKYFVGRAKPKEVEK